MTRAVGIDPGTVSFDICGRDGDVLFLDETYPTADVSDDPGVAGGRLARRRSRGPRRRPVGVRPALDGRPRPRPGGARPAAAGRRRGWAARDDRRRHGPCAGGAQGVRSPGVLRARRAAAHDGPGTPQSQPHRHGHGRQALRGRPGRVGPGAPPGPAVPRHFVRVRRGRRRVHGRRRRRGRRDHRRRGRHLRRHGVSGARRHGRRARVPAQGLLQGRPGQRRRGVDRGRPGLLAGGVRAPPRRAAAVRPSRWPPCSSR